MTEGACLLCGTALVGRRRRYCSDKCQSRAGNRRHRAAHPGIEAARYRAKRDADPEGMRRRAREYYHANKHLWQAGSRRFREANPNIHVLYQHGISPDELAELYRAQHGRCAICDAPGPMRGRGCLVIDHDHETGLRRGLICHDCNKALPTVERVGPTWALRALAYLGDPPLPRLRKRRETA